MDYLPPNVMVNITDAMVDIALASKEPVEIATKAMFVGIVETLLRDADDCAPFTSAVLKYCKSEIDSYAVFAELCRRTGNVLNGYLDHPFSRWVLDSLLQAGKGSALKYLLDTCPRNERKALRMRVIKYIRSGHAPNLLKRRLVLAFGVGYVLHQVRELNRKEYNLFRDFGHDVEDYSYSRDWAGVRQFVLGDILKRSSF